MEFFVYLKKHPDGKPWKFWAIAENDLGQVVVRFGTYNTQLRLQNSRNLDLKGRAPAAVMQSQVATKRSEGYETYEDGRFFVGVDGVMIPMINNTQTGSLFNKPIVYVSGEVSNLDFRSEFSTSEFKSIFGDSLEIFQAPFSLNLNSGDHQPFTVTFTYMQGPKKYKVVAQMKHNSPPLAGMLLLYLNHLVIKSQTGSLNFADVDSNAIKFDKSYSNSDIRVFNHVDLPNFRDSLEDLGVLKQLFKMKSVGSIKHAVSF